MVTLVITTLNEEYSIGSLLEDVSHQTRKPKELVVVDGGSTDGTVHIVRGFEDKLREVGIRLVVKLLPGANIAEGRNAGIRLAEGPIITVTDAGCRLHPQWLKRLVNPLLLQEADFVGGFFRPVARTAFQRVVAALTTASKPGKGFLPSSRSVGFTKELWTNVGGYPEWLPWGEDTYFNCSCLQRGARYRVVEDAVVFWEVRSTFRGILKQQFRYAFGDGLAGRVSRSHIAVQALWLVSFAGCVLRGAAWLLPVLVYPAAWALRKGGVGFREFPLAYTVASAIHWARFSGYLWGLMHKLTRVFGRAIRT